MKKINKEILSDEIKSIANILITSGCLIGGIMLIMLIIPSGSLWAIVGTACFVIIPPLVLLVILGYDRKKDIRILKNYNFFIVKKSVTSIEHISNDVSDNSTVYRKYLYKFGKYGSIILEECRDITWNSSNTYFYLLIWGEKKIIKHVYPCNQWEIDENEFVKEDEIYRLKNLQPN